MITTADSEILFKKYIKYNNMSVNSYTDIDMGLHLKAGVSYYLTINELKEYPVTVEWGY